jgi:hypothetical protein
MKKLLLMSTVLLAGCANATSISPDPNESVYVVDRTLREHKNFDWVIQQNDLWVSIKNTCRQSAYLRSISETTIGELAKHPDWVEVNIDP